MAARLPSGVGVRLFLSLWVVYCAHFATDFVREHFLVVSIVDRGTFDLDPYYGMHPDIFMTPEGHAYHGANPGISMIGAVPYFLLKPVVDRVVEAELARRGPEVSAVYEDPRETRREFYRTARENGWDIRFGLVGIITMVLCMAPLTAGSAVVVWRTLGNAGLPAGQALGGALLYGLGTPLFFRTGYLNQNLAVALFAVVAFCLLWNPGERSRLSVRTRMFLAGLLGGLSVLCDYSGGVALAMLGLYALVRRLDDVAPPRAVRDSLWLVAGAVGPVLLLWFYQWAAFGDFLRPPQHHMPPVEWSDLGYQGVTGPQWELFSLLLFDARFGLFTTAPWLILGVLAPFWPVGRDGTPVLPRRELLFCVGIFLGFALFFSAVQYTRIQYFTGIRYIVPVVPFLLLASLVPLRRLPRAATWAVAFVAFAWSWIQAMARIQEQETSLLQPALRVMFEGLQLPALETLERMSAQYAPGVGTGISSTPALLGLAAVVVLIWTVRRPWTPLASDGASAGAGAGADAR